MKRPRAASLSVLLLAGLLSGLLTALPAHADPGTQLVFDPTTGEPPASVVAGATFQVVVNVEDGGGTIDTTSTASVSLTISAGTLGGTTTVSAVSGVATFPGLFVNQAGTGYTLTAAATGLTSGVSDAFDVTAGTGTQLAFDPSGQPPATIGSGASFGVTVDVEDGLGNIDPTSTASVSLEVSGGTPPLGGTTTESAVAGVATFTGLSVAKAGTGYTLDASATGFPDATSDSFDVTAGTGTHLAFDASGEPPASIVEGHSFGVTVDVEDGGGNIDTTSTAQVTLTISSGTLTGTKKVNAVAGVATFVGLSVKQAGTGYTLTAAASGLTNGTSASFDVTAGTGTQLVFDASGQPPSTIGAGATFKVIVDVEDGGGNIDTTSTASVTLTISGGATLSGTKTVAAASGVATFGGLSVAQAGTGYTLTAAAAGLTPDTSDSFDVTAGSADHLVFTQQPPTYRKYGVALPDLLVQAQDAHDNPVSGTGTATIAIGSNPTGGTLSGTKSVSPNGAGEWVFGGLSIDKPGAGYTLVVTVTGVTKVTSQAFNIRGPTPFTLSANHSVITAGGYVTLTVHLGNCLPPCAEPTITYKLPDGSEHDLPVTPGDWNADTHTLAVSSQRYKNATYSAHFAGDDRYLPEASNAATVNVHARIGGGLQGGYGFSHGYRLYHYQSACSASGKKCPVFIGSVSPNKAGRKLGFTLQEFVAGHWRTVKTESYTIGNDSSVGVAWRYPTTVGGTPLRTHATYGGDAFNLSGTGAWQYFKVMG